MFLPNGIILISLNADFISHPAPFGEGFRYHVTGLTHDKERVSQRQKQTRSFKTLKNKKKDRASKELILDYETQCMDDALYAIIAYGTAAKSG
jgi:2-oxoglutarate ferredoxin oxidoreductase subunit alpha